MIKILLSLCILLPSAAVSAFSIRPLTAPAGYTLKETVCRTHTMQQDGFPSDKQPPHSYLVRRGGSFRIIFPDGRAASLPEPLSDSSAARIEAGLTWLADPVPGARFHPAF